MQDSAELLTDLQQRPAMYLGTQSLSALRHFLNGYALASEHYSNATNCDPLIIPKDFHAWVAYRLGYQESALGWCTMLIEKSESEAAAFDKFFDLLEEYRRRKPHLVAKLVGYKKSYQCYRQHKIRGKWTSGEAETRVYPDSISLVTYTNDRGFFAYSDTQDEFPSEGFFGSIESFESATGANRDLLTIIDSKWGEGL